MSPDLTKVEQLVKTLEECFFTKVSVVDKSESSILLATTEWGLEVYIGQQTIIITYLIVEEDLRRQG